jgi:hypothetical protein
MTLTPEYAMLKACAACSELGLKRLKIGLAAVARQARSPELRAKATRAFDIFSVTNANWIIATTERLRRSVQLSA